MRSIRLAVLALALPSPAWAFGIGTTAYGGSDFGYWWNVFGTSNFVGITFLPSLDLYPNDNLQIQIHALDTLARLIVDENIFLGANVNFMLHRAPALPSTYGIVTVGPSVDVWDDIGNDTVLVLGGVSRIGVEGGSDAHVGLYVSPGLGIATGGGDSDVVWSGTVQVSVWFGSGGSVNAGGGGAPPPPPPP